MCPSEYNILHMSRQCYYHDVYKISLWLVKCIMNKNITKFRWILIWSNYCQSDRHQINGVSSHDNHQSDMLLLDWGNFTVYSVCIKLIITSVLILKNSLTKFIYMLTNLIGCINSLWPGDTTWQIDLGQHWHISYVMACWLMAPSHYLNQCWLIMTFCGIHLRAITRTPDIVP